MVPFCTLAGSSPVATLNKLLTANMPVPGLDLDGIGKMETGQAGGLDFQHGDLQPRLGPQQLRLELPPVGQHYGDEIGVQRVGVGGEDMALRAKSTCRFDSPPCRACRRRR